MISISPSVFSANHADISHSVSSRPQKRILLIALCGIVPILLCGAEAIAVSQTASGGQFGSVHVGSSSSAVTTPLTFGAAGTLSSIAVLTQGATGLDFADAGTGTCASNTAYVAGQVCTVNVIFTPRFAGARHGAIVLNDNTGNILATGNLQGTGIGPQINFLGPQINFLPVAESTVGSSSSGLNAPYAIAVDGSGSVYLTDVGNNLIWKETPSAGGYAPSVIPTSSLGQPTGIAVDGAGNIYISDTINPRVLKETPSAGGYIESVVVDGPNNGIFYPYSVALDGAGSIYFFGFDAQNEQHLYKETPSAGSYLQSTIPCSGFFSLSPIAVSDSGMVFIVDNMIQQLVVETPSEDGYSQSILPTSGLLALNALALDGRGNVFIGDYSAGVVVEETPFAGGYIQTAIPISEGNGPLGVAVDGLGNVFVTDAFNSRVLKEDLADAPSLAFASTLVGSTSSDSPQTVTVGNVGNAPLGFPASGGGRNPSISPDFALNSGGDSACPVVRRGSSSAGTLAAGASCQLSISFAPKAVGTFDGSLVLTDNNLNAAAPGYSSQSIALSGTGTQAPPIITWATPAPITYGRPLRHSQLNARSNVAGTFTYSPAAGTVVGAGQQTLTVTFTPNDSTDYTTATATVTLTVNPATPKINWDTPNDIRYGTPLSGRQLDARSTVPGIFNYSPAAGTVLRIGRHQLTAIFTPADGADYTSATDTVTLTVIR